MNMRISSIRYNNSLVDGPGIRTVLFMQGCDIRCPGCQNASIWDLEGGVEIEIGTLLAELIKNVINKKITISGGEPLAQLDALAVLIDGLYREGFDIALYTGHQKNDVPETIITKLQYLKTGPFIEVQKTTTKPFVGSTNQVFERIEKNETIK